jgi:hypothetical protein
VAYAPSRLLHFVVTPSLAMLGLLTVARTANALSFDVNSDHCSGGCGTGRTHFIANSADYFFVSDIIGPTGNTGDVASTGPVPGPKSLFLVASGLLGLAAAGGKRRT